jgi:restriction system protein
MPIPNYEYFMLPILQKIQEGNEFNFRDVTYEILKNLHLTEEERTRLLPSGATLVVNSRIGWARTYLAKAGLIKGTRRGHLIISQEGIKLLSTNPKEINLKLLEQYESFRIWRTRSSGDFDKSDKTHKNKTPDELIENELQIIKNQLEDDLLEQLKQVSPRKFEFIVVDLLVKMGYGGSKKEAAQVVGKSGDGGIDGIIKEDKLGLEAVYIQAKRWDSQIGRPEIQKFAGALLGQKAKKGVFLTTGMFSGDALKYAENLDTKIVLIDGNYLVSLLYEYNLGVSISKRYEIKKIDSDYFFEDE